MSVNWTRDAAAHLLRRAGFGGTPAEIDALFARGLRGRRLLPGRLRLDRHLGLRGRARRPELQPPEDRAALQQWFLDRMAFSPRPLEEKMTYFWNLHWTSGISKVKGETLILNQNKTERQLRDGEVRRPRPRDLAGPGDARLARQRTNKAARPNENYARELMELFTLGIGNYTQTDVTEVARALTGLDGPELQPGRRTTTRRPSSTTPRIHDNGLKTILGQTGNFDGTDAIGIILDHADAARLGLGALPRREALDVLRRRPTRRTTSSTSSRRVYATSGPLDPRGRAGDLPPRRVLRGPLAARPGSAARSSTRSRRSGCSRGRRDFSSPATRSPGWARSLFNPSDAKGWDWGIVVDEHGLALRARVALQHARDQPRHRAARASIRTRCSPGRTPRRRTRSWTCSPSRLNVDDVSPERPRGVDRLHERERRRLARAPGRTRPPTWTRRCAASCT